MQTNKNTLKIAEFFLVALVWLVIIAAPVFMNDENNFEWQRFISRMEVNILVFIVFIINRFVLVPYLLNKKKRLLYICVVLSVIATATFGSFMYNSNPGDQRFIPPPDTNRNVQVMPAPPPHTLQNNDQLLPHMPHPDPDHVPPFLNVLLFSILLIGFDTGLMTSFKLAKTENEKAKLEKENVENQLAFLRNQISPHFFMNTLNNIHAQIDFDTEEAKNSIIKLSKLMRHILYEAEVEKSPIKKEMDFIINYVGLMKLRFTEKVKVNLTTPSKIPDKSIPPILFISFIENAFKHGISYNSESFVDISISINNDWMNMKIINSNHISDNKESAYGIGIINTRKRLELIYKDNYQLEITDNNDIYSINLSIPL